MAKTTPEKRAYMAQYENTPEEIKKREARNRARYDAEVAGQVKKGDNRDIGHKKALDNGGKGTPANVEVESRARNRGWRKGQKGYKVPNIK